MEMLMWILKLVFKGFFGSIIQSDVVLPVCFFFLSIPNSFLRRRLSQSQLALHFQPAFNALEAVDEKQLTKRLGDLVRTDLVQHVVDGAKMALVDASLTTSSNEVLHVQAAFVGGQLGILRAGKGEGRRGSS